MESATSTREKILRKIRVTFEEVAIEGHLQGSIARGNTDEYSDIDIWLTFNDEDFELIKGKRFDFYAKVGEILHVCEPPQNRPTSGVFSSLIYKTEAGLLVVDYVLCPLSTSYRTDDYKRLFGNLELPFGKFQYNLEKVPLPETYRLDFFISNLNGGVKKLLRKDENALEFLFGQYNGLKDSYDIQVEDIEKLENTFETLTDIIENVKKVATEKQRGVLNEIKNFAGHLQSTRHSDAETSDSNF